ncbi:24719_t:CDS:1, partial [Racocetra persica]
DIAIVIAISLDIKSRSDIGMIIKNSHLACSLISNQIYDCGF